jgi:hypothetical protein
LKRDGVMDALKIEPYALLCNDWDAVQAAVLDGKPVAPGTQLGRCVVALADRLLGREPKAKKRTSLFGLLGIRK